MFGLTSTQLALLQARTQQIKASISIGITSPLRYCTGADAISIDANWYTPRNMSFDEIKLDSPNSAACAIVLDDLDGVIRTAWYAERFSGVDVDMYLHILTSDGTWTEVIDLGWICTTCAFNKFGQFRLNLIGGAGLRPRAGLMTGSRTSFPFAPEAGEALRFGTGGISFHPGNPTPPPPPGGTQTPYQYRYQIPATDGESVRALNEILGGFHVDRPRDAPPTQGAGAATS